jgi:thiamine biosynthesis lipoprotein
VTVAIRTEVAMGTIVRIETPGHDADGPIERAFGWFREIETRCTRFDPASELMRLCARPGVAVAASPMLFEAVRFAISVAETSGGAFDPTLGRHMEARGFDRNYRTGEAVRSGGPQGASYCDVELDADRRTIRLRRPMTLDLGAVAKGLAVDLATRELEPLRDFAIDAGGDLYLGGCNGNGEPWSVGVGHPGKPGELIAALRVSGQAVCTSGNYERRAAGGENHILDPRTGAEARCAASVTVVAPGAMAADALATAAFVLGPKDGMELLERAGVEGLFVTPKLELLRTRDFRHAA